MSAERSVKRQRILDLLDRADGDAIWLTSPAALSWYLDGARVHTSLVGPPIAAVRVDRDGDHVRAFSNEADRLLAEELPSDVTVDPVAWHEQLVTDADAPRVFSEDDLALELRAARAQLLPEERARYAKLCHDAAAVLTAELALTRPDESEFDVAGRVSGALVAVGADPAVIMVSGASRALHRHPLPTASAVGSRAMVVVGARRHGLIANLTRWIRFGPADEESLRSSEAIRAVEADIFRATRVGRSLGDVLGDITAAYPRHGFDAQEWTRHHQGGAAGYSGRDPRATPGGADLVQDGQAFAWNPTAPGQKIEDTVILDGERISVLTRDGAWPEVDVDGVSRPIELEL